LLTILIEPKDYSSATENFEVAPYRLGDSIPIDEVGFKLMDIHFPIGE